MNKLPNEIINIIMRYNSSPCADIIKEHFKNDVPYVSKFVYLRYFGFLPLTQFGSNGRQIHNEYDEYWQEWT